MGVAFAPELAEAIKESAERQGLSVDGWIVAAAALKFRADDEAEALGEAERKRRLALWHEYVAEYQVDFGAVTEEEMAEAAKRRQEATRGASAGRRVPGQKSRRVPGRKRG